MDKEEELLSAYGYDEQDEELSYWQLSDFNELLEEKSYDDLSKLQ